VTGVFDVDSIGLVQMAANLNRGLDIGGNPIDPPTGLFIGVGANRAQWTLSARSTGTSGRSDAGAEFAITQPVFDPEALLRFLDRVETYAEDPRARGSVAAHQLQERRVHEQRGPRRVVPKAILDRMSRCRTRETGEAGIEIARGSSRGSRTG